MHPRLTIAAAFFILGALIAVPALNSAATSAQAERTSPAGAPAAAQTPSPTPSESEDPPKPSPSPTATPTRTPSPTPTPSATPTKPSVPIVAEASKVACPWSNVTITVTSKSDKTEDYTVTIDGATVVADRIQPGGTRTARLTVAEDKSSRLEVIWGGRTVLSVRRKADCVRDETEAPEDDDGKGAPGGKLPHTGPDDDLFAKVATGIAAMITGLVIFWYGSLWPRRRTPELD